MFAIFFLGRFWKDGLLTELQAKMPRGCRILLFWHNNYQVTLKSNIKYNILFYLSAIILAISPEYDFNPKNKTKETNLCFSNFFFSIFIILLGYSILLKLEKCLCVCLRASWLLCHFMDLRAPNLVTPRIRLHNHTIRWQSVFMRECQGGNPIGKALVEEKSYKEK